MNAKINGLHHITAITAGARGNVAFYTKLLGLRFVKKTVNFDDPTAYHLYYGDEVGSPGTALTFFAWEQMGPGRPGAGETALTQFAVPAGSLPFWRDRLARADVSVDGPLTVAGEERLELRDPDGMRVALVAPEAPDQRTPWTEAGVGPDAAIRGFHGVTLALSDPRPTAELLTTLFGYVEAGRDGDTIRLAAPAAARARVVDLIRVPGTPALQGTSSVHHIAFAIADAAAQAAFRDELTAFGITPTPQIDRTYFTSIYFRSPGGVQFEVATEGPGFTVDEPVGELGRNLRLPPQHEHLRAALERTLPSLRD
jgi:glyoxalase family protein